MFRGFRARRVTGAFVVLSSLSVAVSCSKREPPARAPKPAATDPSEPAHVLAEPEGTGQLLGPAAGARPRPPDTVESTDSTGDRGWLGVELGATDAKEPGVLIRGVIRGAPAAAAGLAQGDVILRIDGEIVTTPEDVARLVGSRAPGQRVSVAFRRGTADRLIGVDLAALPVRDEIVRMNFVGARAPDFADLKTVQGNVLPSLRALKGRVLVLEFWASWCVACRLLVPAMNDWHASYRAQGAEVIGITTEGVELAANTASQLGMSYSLFSDASGQTTEAYRALALPTVFVIDREGVVRDVMIGYSSPKLAEMEALVAQLLREK